MKRKIKMYGYKILACISITVGLSSCFEETEFEKLQKESDQKIVDYLEANNINAAQSSGGIYFEKLNENANGEYLSHEDIAVVRYEMWTLDGSLVVSAKEDTSLFKIGTSSILPNGVLYGIDVARTGETVRFYLPTYLAYNAYQPDNNLFDAYDNFIIEMELVSILDNDEVNQLEVATIESYILDHQLVDVDSTDNGLFFKSTIAGDGELAQSTDEVTLHYTRKYLDESIIQTTKNGDPLTVTLNQGQLVDGLTEGILKMKAGETALLMMPSHLAFGSSVQVFPESLRQQLYEDRIISNLVAPYSPVIYEVELLEIK